MEKDIMLNKLERIEKCIVGTKNVLDVEELVAYTGFKKSYIYKLVHKKIIPYSKPMVRCYFLIDSK